MEEEIALLYAQDGEITIPVFTLPEWNSKTSLEDAWTDILIEVQGSPLILDIISLDDRIYLIQCLRSIRKSYSHYPLRPFSKVLFVNHGIPVCQILLTQEEPEKGRWGKIEIQPKKPKEEEDKNNQIPQHSIIRVFAGCFSTCLIISIITWALTIQVV